MNIKCILLAFLTCLTISAQSFREVQLRKPDKISPLFVGPIFKSTIHYGAAPSNYNGKVLVFNHGYIDLNQIQFLFDNSFYEQAYDEGYQTVFVATTRGGGIWKNGRLMAEALDIITEKYNVPDVSIIAHSNGGKAAEAAMIAYGKNEKVKRVFALGTPYWGTYVADVSQFPLLRWAWSLTGLNEGARTSTTYYNRDVVRPFLDNEPNNEPGKFVVIGATGFDRGSNPFARAGFRLTGGIILPQQGTNDGVAPYQSTLRPGATNIFVDNDSRGLIDHIDVGLGQFSWQYISPLLKSDQVKSARRIASYQPATRIESDHYIVYSENKYDQIILDEDATYALATILHKDSNANFQLYADGNKSAESTRSFSSENHETTIAISNYKSTLDSDSPFVAFIRPNNDVRMYFDQEKTNGSLVLKTGFTSVNKKNFSSDEALVRATITKTATITGEEVNASPEIFDFNIKNGEFLLNTDEFSPGVYSILVTGESQGRFRRNIMSGFVVGDIKSELSTLGSVLPETLHKTSFTLLPTIIDNQALVSLTDDQIRGQIDLQIFDMSGKLVVDAKPEIKSLKQVDISRHTSGLLAGIYILKINDYPSQKFIKK